MLQELNKHEETSRIIRCHKNEMYFAVMAEDLRRIEDVSKKHGSNFPIEVQDAAPAKVFQKVQ